MKKGFWNYTDPVTYRVVLVKLYPVANPPLHWQNAFAGQTRQAVEIKDVKGYRFLIDNEDGSGMSKVENRGCPGQMSRHIQHGAYDIEMEVHPENWKMEIDAQVLRDTDAAVDAWQKENHPAEYEKAQALKAAWATSEWNPKNRK